MHDNADRMIDLEHGRVQNNLLESGFFHVWASGVKRRCMGANHFYMIACEGLLNSNQTAMRAVKGPEYSWRLAVYNKLRMPVTATVVGKEKKRQLKREKNRLRMQQRRADGRKGRGKHEAHHRQQQRKSNAQMMRDARGFEHLSLIHTGKTPKLAPSLKKNSKVVKTASKASTSDAKSDVVELVSWIDCEPRLVEPAGRLLVVLDINETLLFRKYLTSSRGYTTPVMRPFVGDFVRRLLLLREQGVIDIATWCGAWTHKRENELLQLLKDNVGLIAKTTGRGSSKVLKTIDVHCRSLPGCKTRHFFKNNPGKSIVIKPVGMLKRMLPQHDDIVLFDNNVEKCMGFSQQPGCRLSNKEGKYIIVKSFRGEDDDNELEFGKGKGCTQLFEYIDEYRKKRDSIQSVRV